MPMLAPAQLIEHLTDAFERSESLPAAATASLAECVPLMAMALEYIGRGPSALTVDAVEKYRLGAVRILEQMRPVIEREADLTLGEWVMGGAEPVQLRLAA